jgi:ATP/maltotriose-dependent transcriptional regulator MalT
MRKETTTLSILSTKLHRPPVDRSHVHRLHLLEQLDQRRSRPLTLVSAPAGYGKSVLIHSWLESCDIPGAWMSLDKNDNDLRTFTAYFVAAVKTLFSGACRNTRALLNASDLTSIAILVAILDRFCPPLCEAVCAPGAEPFTCDSTGIGQGLCCRMNTLRVSG